VARDAILAKQVCVARNQITLFAEGAVIGLTGLLDDRRESQLARDVNSQSPCATIFLAARRSQPGRSPGDCACRTEQATVSSGHGLHHRAQSKKSKRACTGTGQQRSQHFRAWSSRAHKHGTQGTRAQGLKLGHRQKEHRPGTQSTRTWDLGHEQR
jgi:hypothetical protein